MTDVSIFFPLNHGQQTCIDAEDYEKVIGRTWHASWSDNTQSYYARTNRKKADDPNWPRTIRMHQLLTGRFDSFTDHWNGDTLDNRKGNLRPATHEQNMANRGPNRNNQLGLKGVCPKRSNSGKLNGRYAAYMRAYGKFEHLGYFDHPASRRGRNDSRFTGSGGAWRIRSTKLFAA